MLGPAFENGRAAALAHFGVKIARGAIGMPMGKPMHPAIAGMHADLHSARMPAAPAAAPAQQGASWADMHKGVAQQQAAAINPHQAPLPAARAFEGLGSAAAGGGTGGGAGAGAGGGGGGIRGALSGAGRFMRPAGKALGYGALAGGAMLAYGMHRQNQEDREARNLVHAPMQGTY